MVASSYSTLPSDYSVDTSSEPRVGGLRGIVDYTAVSLVDDVFAGGETLSSSAAPVSGDRVEMH